MTGSPRSEVSDNSNVWEVDWANAVLDAHNEITNYLTGLSWTEVIVSRYTGGAARPFGVTFNVEEWQLTDVVVDSRRDRLP